ncbi:MAG: hypothetical protein QOJ91_691 [Sphingomonadales bacterium]|jgi:hypothetical protein|nr:hypothetical protein [Sphingomonadales bacterium]
MASDRERPTTVERAFELARSGQCDNLPAIVAALKGERHESVDAHLAGPSIRKDLRKVWEAQGKAAPSGGDEA